MTRLPAVVRAAPLGLVLVLAMAACAERAAPPASRPPPAAPLPEDADALVLQVERTGGFATPEMLTGRLPLISVHADGRVITEGPVLAVYPGPAWPNVLVQHADPAAVQALVGHALDAGVADTEDLGMPAIADATSTRFTVTTAEGSSTRTVYALTEGAGATTGLTRAQQAARAELADLYARLTDFPSTLGPPDGAPASYEPTGVAAIVRPWTPIEADPALTTRPDLPWPGPALPGEPVGPDVGCVVATGDQSAAVVAAARGADQLTAWTSGDGARWSITFRPLLPHESGCADLISD